MWMHADDAIDQIYWVMALKCLWKEEVNKMFPRHYYPSEISLFETGGDIKKWDFKKWIYRNL